ncbi:cytochrome ubiquinol oxidase subunit II [Sphingomonas metalli]|uniref:Ubiquinol oxidase subunit 2 n=1 Tax=Sphingomonas metalli TaxID=1779358 RepID=A0A916WPD6_9SPHN|nr:ubiquinol oxidase subunit II [Sphingomonas metalli]GGB21827.1 cytochrome ubiquinol oxidase subunit II [Sphingomonas metalli]
MALLAAVSGCAPTSVLAPEGPVAAANRQILFNSLAIMLAIVVPTIIATLAFAWWFRAGNSKARYQPHFVYSGKIELIVWSIPIMIILFLGGVIWVGSHDQDPRRPVAAAPGQTTPPLEVQVVSLDWKWLFIYPGQGIATVNRLVLPVGRPVRFRLTSASVMNTFFVPRLGSMIYTMNGMETQLNLRADRVGRIWGQSSHYSGDGFSDMNFAVDTVSAADFDRFVGTVRGGGPVLDVPGYAALARQSLDVHPFSYRAAQPGLFDAIVSQQLKPSAGPQEGRGGPQVSPKPPEMG